MNAKTARALTHGASTLDQPIWQLMSVLLYLVGSAFWTAAQFTDEPFNVETFGHFALQFPAEFWAGLMMGAATITIVGLARPQQRGLVVFGSLLQAGQFLGIAYSAIMTGGEFGIGLFASVFFAPIWLFLAFEARRDDGD